MGLALLRIAGWFAVLPWLACTFLVVTGGSSWSAIVTMLAAGVVLAGLLTLPFPEQPWRRRRGVVRGGLVAIALVTLVHGLTIGNGRTLRLLDQDGKSPRAVTRLFEEPDIAVAAARAAYVIGFLHDDGNEAPRAFGAAYEALVKEEGRLPAPVFPTHLGLERPGSFDLALVDDAPGTTTDAVVFLHGSAGNFLLPCWQFAKAVRPLHIATACPSTGWTADWGDPHGEATVRKTLDVLRARGFQRFALAGLSAGGIGASVLAPRIEGLRGLVLVSGAEPEAPHPGVPTLLLHGVEDRHVDVDDARAYASRTGARLEEYPGRGHFVFLVRHDELAARIRAFMAPLF